MATIAVNSTRRLADIEIGVEGQGLHSPGESSFHKVVDEATGLAAGRAVVRGTDLDRDVSLPSALAADVDYFVTQDAALGSVSEEAYSGAGFTGAYSAGVALNPPRNVTITQDADANWDATTAVVVGLDQFGNRVTESLSLTDGGAAVATGEKFFSVVESVTIPVQSGDAPGTIGLGTEAGPLEVVGFTQRQGGQELQDYAAGANTTSTAVLFEDDTDVKVIGRGRLVVVSEDAATAGGLVYVRQVADGNEELGAVRATADGSAGAPDATPVSTGGVLWRFVTSTSSTGELAVIERV